MSFVPPTPKVAGPATGGWRLLALALLAGLAAGCSSGTNASPGGTPAPAAPAASSPKTVAAPPGPSIDRERKVFSFDEIAKAAGIDFRHVSGMTQEKHYPTANGSGVGIFDYDGDGKMDIYLLSTTYMPVGSRKEGQNRLYKNLGGDKFRDVTKESGLGFAGFCHGVIVGDVDGDGDPDVFLCNYGPNVLYLNNGDGTFKDVSKAAGIDAPHWSSGGAFLDMDNDGDLDLYVSNYGEWSLEKDGTLFCGNEAKKIRQYCSPKTIRTTKHLFYRNDGVKDGVPHFTDVYDHVFYVSEPQADGSEKMVQVPGRPRNKDKTDGGHGFGVVATDLNDDGLIDLYVANDQNPAFTFYNRGDGTFRDATEESGAAYNENGNTQSGMGTDAEDLDGDGKPELIRTNFKDEPNAVYKNMGGGLFYDQSLGFNMTADVLPYVKWGVGLVDFDNDGWPDCFVTNGHVDDNYHLLDLDQPYEELPTLHWNVANGSTRKFALARAGAGSYFSTTHVGRGCAFGDLDDDGRPDIVVNHKDNTPAVLMNRTKLGDNRWIRLVLRGTRSNRDAIGAKVTVAVGERKIYRQRKSGGSMESANDPRLLIGVGPAQQVDTLTIRWPRGGETVLKNVEVNKTHTVVEPAEAPKPSGGKEAP